MRRIAAVFASKRSDRSDATSSQNDAHSASSHTYPTSKSVTRFFHTLSKKAPPPTAPVESPLSTRTHPPSSSSSSSGAPTTPGDDDHNSLLPPPSKRGSWTNGGEPLARLTSPAGEATVAHARLPQQRGPSPPRHLQHDYHDDSSEDDRSDAESSPSQPTLRKAPTPVSAACPPQIYEPPLAPVAYVRALTLNGLAEPFAPPPLLHVPGRPLFPRSCNTRPALANSPPESLRIRMFKQRLLRRLEGGLMPAEERMLAPLGGRRRPLPRPSLHFDDTAVPADAVQGVASHSEGLRKWVSRLCFEDRLVVYLPSAHADEEVVWTRVCAGLGVAALEFSEGLELLAYGADAEGAPGGGFQDADPPSGTPSSLSPASSDPPTPASIAPPFGSLSVSAPSQSRGQTYKTSPSPLRIEHSPSPSHLSPPTSSPTAFMSSTPTLVPSPSASTASLTKSATPNSKPVVRFADAPPTEKQDRVPLDYVLRIKQQRAEKARFLEAEKARRALEDERRKHDEERRLWEQERAGWERERRAHDEERKKKTLADEVAAARRRRESARVPVQGVTGAGAKEGESMAMERERETRGREAKGHARPVHDPAMSRKTSEVNVPRSSSNINVGTASRTDLPIRPASVVGSGSQNGSVRGMPPNSSPPGAEVRPQMRERQSSWRGSMVSDALRAPDRSSTMPQVASMWNMNMIPPVPPMPIMPVAVPIAMPVTMPPSSFGMGMGMRMGGMGMDMPLLPPTPPFVMQDLAYRPPSGTGNRQSNSQSPGNNGSSGHRSHSSSPVPMPTHRSQSSSPTLGRSARGPSANASLERVHQSQQQRPTSHQHRSSSSPGPGPIPPVRPSHHRTSSHELRPETRSSSLRPAVGPRVHSDDRRVAKTSVPSRPVVVHHSSAPTPTANPPRGSWATPNEGFVNLSRPSNRRQSVVS
ncbi:hypothetical protein OBBRIDRAFT_789656 [Obba rivulosa]|uniref:Uncharacterized protein n=1 Tax=Obba rivulosa TaxID=1052685 RepID=A0A8E2DQU7_9APHY|nr:hypothetical protein OBBRIDRAFT_789656 [Obba rivulosa]